VSGTLNDADAQNSFGICLEWGIGVQSNLALAAHYSQRATLQGHPDRANNLGFCREHGRGVEQGIRLVAEHYESAAGRGHPEGGLNYRRCPRLLGRWNPPDRSSQVSAYPPSNNRLAALFIDCLKEPKALNGASIESIAFIERLQASLSAKTPSQMRTAKWDTKSEFECRDSSVAKLAHGPDGTLSVVKFAETARGFRLIQCEAAIHKGLKHPLILKFCRSNPGRFGPNAIVTELAGNGSLASHLLSAEAREMGQLQGETRVAKIIVGIVLAMRYLHSQEVIQCNLNADNVLPHLDWNISIAAFGYSISRDEAFQAPI
jgi:hypothetical protein